MANKDPKRDLQGICQPIADQMGYELVEVGIEKEGPFRYLRAYIDKPDGVTFDDCEAYHRAVQSKLEHIEYDFLEISSPGLDRPLKTQRDFDKHVGEEISVKLFQAIEKRKEFEGILMGLEDGQIVLQTSGGEILRFAQRAVAVARPQISLEGLEDDMDHDTARPGGATGQ